MFIKAYSRVADVEPFVYPKGAAGLSLVMGPQRADGTYPAIEVTENTIFETVSTATVAATVVGSAVTLSTDALGVTATTTSGVFKILDTDGATTNSTVRGVFVTPAAAAA